MFYRSDWLLFKFKNFLFIFLIAYHELYFKFAETKIFDADFLNLHKEKCPDVFLPEY